MFKFRFDIGKGGVSVFIEPSSGFKQFIERYNMIFRAILGPIHNRNKIFNGRELVYMIDKPFVEVFCINNGADLSDIHKIYQCVVVKIFVKRNNRAV